MSGAAAAQALKNLAKSTSGAIQEEPPVVSSTYTGIKVNKQQQGKRVISKKAIKKRGNSQPKLVDKENDPPADLKDSKEQKEDATPQSPVSNQF